MKYTYVIIERSRSSVVQLFQEPPTWFRSNWRAFSLGKSFSCLNIDWRNSPNSRFSGPLFSLFKSTSAWLLALSSWLIFLDICFYFTFWATQLPTDACVTVDDEDAIQVSILFFVYHAMNEICYCFDQNTLTTRGRNDKWWWGCWCS